MLWTSLCTENPSGDWISQQGRNFQMHLENNELRYEILMRDRDRKYVDKFDEIVGSTEGKIKLMPILSPNLQADVERVIQTIKHEVLTAFCIATNRRLNQILRSTQGWYNKRAGSFRAKPLASDPQRNCRYAIQVQQRPGRLRFRAGWAFVELSAGGLIWGSSGAFSHRRSEDSKRIELCCELKRFSKLLPFLNLDLSQPAK